MERRRLLRTARELTDAPELPIELLQRACFIDSSMLDGGWLRYG